MREFNVGAKICGSRSFVVLSGQFKCKTMWVPTKEVFAFLCDIVTQEVKRSAFDARGQPTRFAHIDWD
jgi:hypothetical protein